MARKRRWFVPGVSAHIIKRGNNRAPTFSCRDDRLRFLALVREASTEHDVGIHAFALMTNHIHLLATPDEATSVPAMMKQLGERYSRYFNCEYQRTGTPWDGRYRAFLILDERYWLTCLRYIELNPVRAGIVVDPGQYEWSSYAVHADGRHTEWLHDHPLFTSLGMSTIERSLAYRRLCAQALTDDEVRKLRKYPTTRGQTSGSDPTGRFDTSAAGDARGW